MPIRSVLRRATRYFNVFLWLARQHLKFQPSLFLAQQTLAVGARLGTIAGLIACAHFLAHIIAAAAHPSPHAPFPGLELSNNAYKVLLVLLPVVLLSASAFAQYLATLLFGRVLDAMTSALAKDYCTRMVGREVQIPLDSGVGYVRLIVTLQRMELQFLMIVQHLLILGGVAFASIFVVGPTIALLVVLLLSAFVSLFLLVRQKHAHQLQRRLSELEEIKVKTLNDLARDETIPAVATGESRIALLDQLYKALYQRQYLSWSFREFSRVANLVVQTVLVGLLLFYVATMPMVDPNQFVRLVSFFVIMRFAFGTVQGVNASALVIAPYYPALVKIIEGRDYLMASQTSMDAGNNWDGDDRLV